MGGRESNVREQDMRIFVFILVIQKNTLICSHPDHNIFFVE